MPTICKRCGDPTYTDTKQLCARCAKLSKDFREQAKSIQHNTPTRDLLRFRNICMDLLNFRQRGGKGFPRDLDYQYKKVVSYLGEEQVYKEDPVN